MFAKRTRWDLRPNRLSDAVEKLRAEGRPLLDLTESNPTRAGLPYPGLEVREALADPLIMQYAPDPMGLRGARDAVADHYRANGIEIDPDRIVLTASTSEAYAWLFKLCTDAGDQVLIPKPSYPLFEFLTTLEDVETVPYSLNWDGEWHVDMPSVRLACCERTRAIVAVSPNNPTGNVLKSAERIALEEICAQRAMPLIVDEVFLDYPAKPGPSLPSVLSSDGPALKFALSGLSKLAGLPQLKLGWIAVAGPARLADEALARLAVIADTYLSVNTPVQVALPMLLDVGASIRAAIQVRVAANRAWLEAHCQSDDPFRVLACEAGWYAILSIPRTVPEEERVIDLARQDGVLVQPGYYFDMPREGHLVVSLLTREEAFRAGMSRVLDRLRA